MFTCENSHRCEFDARMTLWFHTAFTWRDTSCRPTWLWRQFELDIEDCACASRSRLPGKCILFPRAYDLLVSGWIPEPLVQQLNKKNSWGSGDENGESDFMLERTPVPRLHDTGMCFRTGMKISLRYSYRGELATVWLAPLWDFVLVDVNEYRATRGNWSELVPEWKSRRYHVNTPLDTGLIRAWHEIGKSQTRYVSFLVFEIDRKRLAVTVSGNIYKARTSLFRNTPAYGITVITLLDRPQNLEIPNLTPFMQDAEKKSRVSSWQKFRKSGHFASWIRKEVVSLDSKINAHVQHGRLHVGDALFLIPSTRRFVNQMP